MRTLAHSLFRDKKILTTEAKAKALRPYAEKLITGARRGTIAARRGAISRLGSARAALALVRDVAPRYKERTGGYTRIVKAGFRKSDGARMAQIELVS